MRPVCVVATLVVFAVLVFGAFVVFVLPEPLPPSPPGYTAPEPPPPTGPTVRT